MDYFAIIVLVVSFIALLSIGVPIAFSIGISGILTMLVSIDMLPAFTTYAHRMATGLDNFALLAIPFFILAGNIMNKGGIAIRLIDFARALVGKTPGGLAFVNIFANMLFGAISGSAAASASAIGSIMGPEMKKEGYDQNFSAAVNISSATTGLSIPPSNVLIVYSLASGGASVTALFIAGYIPGIMTGLALMITSLSLLIYNKRGARGVMKILAKVLIVTALILLFLTALNYAGNNFGHPVMRVIHAIIGVGALVFMVRRTIINRDKAKHGTLKFLDALPSLMMLVIVIGGIIAGYFTATEASAVAVLYSLILAFIYKKLKWKDLPEVFIRSIKTTSIVLLLVAASMGLSWIMAFENIPQNVSSGLLSLSDNPLVILLVINMILLFVGVFMDMTPAILIFTPIFLPIVQYQLGLDPVHFGIIMVLNLSVGLCTPPVGSVLFIGCSVAKVKIEKVVRPLLPLFIAMIVILLLVTYLPELSLWLPKFFGAI
ncbi:MAG: TRAP transporter large permease [Bacteroidales bacterium]|nr:TRAP transporter large permease [Bacteroidales bacterium]